jgi:WD40 repeat protein
MISGAPSKLFIGLILVMLASAGMVHAEAERLTADIVYSARYYNPGTQPSHYKIWRIDSAGSGRVQVTSGGTDDHSPIWLADGKTILFVREKGKTRTLCTINERGGAITTLAALPAGFIFIKSIAPDRGSVIYLLRDSEWRLVLFDVATRTERALGTGGETVWSPDSRQLYISTWGESKPSAQILNLSTGSRISLTGDLRAATWVDDHRLVAEAFAKRKESAGMVILRADGAKDGEVSLPFTWEDESDEFSPFADNMFAIPGDRDSILYGRHAGNSTEGAIQMFYRVDLKGGAPTALVKGRDLAWSPDHKSFITGSGRRLAALSRKRQVWVSPLSIVTLASGEARSLVRGLVSVEGFDWRPPKTVSK